MGEHCSRSSVAAFADVAFYYIDKRIQPFIRCARSFAQTKNLLRVRLDFSFVNFSDRQERANALFSSRPPFVGAPPPLFSLFLGFGPGFRNSVDLRA